MAATGAPDLQSIGSGARAGLDVAAVVAALLTGVIHAAGLLSGWAKMPPRWRLRCIPAIPSN